MNFSFEVGQDFLPRAFWNCLPDSRRQTASQERIPRTGLQEARCRRRDPGYRRDERSRQPMLNPAYLREYAASYP